MKVVKVEKEVICEGTIVEVEGISAEEDCQSLQELFDEPSDKQSKEKVVLTIALRSNGQRLAMKEKYKELYEEKDLVESLKKELGDKYDQTLEALFRRDDEYHAWCLHEAMDKVGTDENVLIDILCTRSNDEMLKIDQVYKGLYGKDLVKDLESETSGAFRKLVMTLVGTGRPTGLWSNLHYFNAKKAKEDASKLHNIEGQAQDSVEECYHTIFTGRSFQQLNTIFKHYESISKKRIEEGIKKNLSGDNEKGYLAIAKFARGQCEYFADAIYDAIENTHDEKALVRLIVSRSEIDLVQIKTSFEAKYTKPLEMFLHEDYKRRSGDYKNLLIQMINGNRDVEVVEEVEEVEIMVEENKE